MENEVDDVAADIRAAMGVVEKSNDDRTVDVETKEVSVKELATEPAIEPTAGERARDVSGKFAPKTPAKVAEEAPKPEQPAIEDQTESAQVQAKPETQQLALKAPASWTPEAREEWAAMTPRVQAEVHRREREITETLRTTAGARNFAQEVFTTLQPYMPMIQAERVTPVQAIQSLFQTAAALRTGTPQNKASFVADLISTYGVDVQELDSVLSARQSGQQPQNRQRQEPQFDPRTIPELQPLFAAADRMRQEEQSTMQTLEQDTVNFMNDPANEFAWDVKDDMADILDMAAKRGRKISLQEAYNRATLLHPTISGVVQSRKQGQSSEQETAAARRARQAAASISGDGAPGRASEDDGGDDSIRSAVLAAINSASRRK
jgi:hypothetical protein